MESHRFRLREYKDTVCCFQYGGNVRRRNWFRYTILNVPRWYHRISSDEKKSFPFNEHREVFFKDFTIYNVTRIFR